MHISSTYNTSKKFYLSREFVETNNGKDNERIYFKEYGKFIIFVQTIIHTNKYILEPRETKR